MKTIYQHFFGRKRTQEEKNNLRALGRFTLKSIAVGLASGLIFVLAYQLINNR